MFCLFALLWMDTFYQVRKRMYSLCKAVWTVDFDSGFQAGDSGFQVLDSLYISLVGGILNSFSWIPDSKAIDS